MFAFASINHWLLAVAGGALIFAVLGVVLAVIVARLYLAGAVLFTMIALTLALGAVVTGSDPSPRPASPAAHVSQALSVPALTPARTLPGPDLSILSAPQARIASQLPLM